MSSDLLSATGLTVKTASDITADLTSGFQGIYGTDIQTAQNSPDGQVIGIFTQAGVDLRELLVQINASFDPDQAVGIQLDQRCAINGVTRVAGSYSIFPIDVVASKTVALQGLDASYNSADGTGYTIQDSNGNEFILIDSATFFAGTTTVDFRAQKIGSVNVPINTITTPVTIINGITSVNNSSAAISVGQDEELDVQIRVRRQKSVSLPSLNYLKGLRASLLALSGVTAAEVYDNRTDAADSNGIPAHGIWAIVEGGANSDIAATIAGKISDGANMKGATSVVITTDSNVAVPILFDRPVAESLYLQFNIKQTVAAFSFDTAGIAAYIAANLSYEVGAYAETSAPTAMAAVAINALGGGGVPIDMKISTDGATWVDFINPTSPAYQFTLAAAHISIAVV